MQDAIEREIAAVLGESDDQSEAIEGESTRANCQVSSDPPRGPLADSAVAVSPPRDDADDLPPWYALPEPWKKRYALNPALGRWEYAQALKRERREREEPRRRISGHPLFRHPGLQNA